MSQWIDFFKFFFATLYNSLCINRPSGLTVIYFFCSKADADIHGWKCLFLDEIFNVDKVSMVRLYGCIRVVWMWDNGHVTGDKIQSIVCGICLVEGYHTLKRDLWLITDLGSLNGESTETLTLFYSVNLVEDVLVV